MRYDEELVVPIIENTPFEHDLSDSMAQVRERERETRNLKQQITDQPTDTHNHRNNRQ